MINLRTQLAWTRSNSSSPFPSACLQVELNFFHEREAWEVDFLSFLRQKRARERELVPRAGANYRNLKWEAKDFEKVYGLS